MLYFGPIREPDLLQFGPIREAKAESGATREDFMLIELRGGYPVLRVNQGSGELRLALDGRDKGGGARIEKLSDGVWHRLDVFKSGKVSCEILR